jgi:Oxidoreductase molybdopterin binding domain
MFSRSFFVALVALTFFPVIAAAQMSAKPGPTPAPVVIKISAETIAALPQVTITVTDESGNKIQYGGARLRDLLVAKGVPVATHLMGADLARSITVIGTDGYPAVYALAEADSEIADAGIILATSRNGNPLPPNLGAVQIIAPGDKRHARWVHGVVEIIVEAPQ